MIWLGQQKIWLGQIDSNQMLWLISSEQNIYPSKKNNILTSQQWD